MKEVNIGVIGFGTVGAGTLQVLWNRKEDIERELNLAITVAKVVDIDWGRDRQLALPSEMKGSDPAAVLDDPSIHIVVEAIGGVDPAFDVVSRALRAGKTVVTPNKELVAKRGRELLSLAAESGSELFFEGAVGGGIPVIQVLKEQMAGDDILEVAGIVNGTTNFILSEMSQQGTSYEAALLEAKKRGYAEPVPVSDVEGYDATYKLAILASLCFHSRVDIENIYREGITGIIPEDIEYARELGYILKLLAIARKEGEELELRVHPVLVSTDHPLAGVSGVENAIYIRSASRRITLRGPGAGGEATGAAIVGDIIEAILNMKHNCRGRSGCVCQGELTARPMEELISQYCVRTHALDCPGVLARVAAEFGKEGVSLSAVKQPVSTPGELTNIYFLTHEVQEARLQRSLEHIRALDVVRDVYAIRVG